MISISKPCRENWDAMAPAAAGHYCASCQETVADFTRMSDAEILTYLQQYPAISCGRFRNGQLNRQLLRPARPVAGWRRGLAAATALLGLGAVAVPAGHAQTIGTAGPIQRQMTGTTLEAADSATQQWKGADNVTGLITISGIVVNQNGNPVGGLEVSLDTENYFQEVAATTDATGNFRFAVAPETLDSTASIQVTVFPRLGSHYQYATALIDKASNQPYLLRLQKRRKPSRHTMGMFR